MLHSLLIDKLLLFFVLFAPIYFFTPTTAYSAALTESERTLIVYNKANPDSLEVADYYANARNIPAANKCGLELSSSTPTYLSYSDYKKYVQSKVQACLTAVGADKILYIVFTYQTPYGVNQSPENGQSLDQHVADIWDQSSYHANPYAVYNTPENNTFIPFVSLATYREQPGAMKIYSVFRLDGPNKKIAKGLVDKALWAEKHGLFGQGCFDRRFGDVSKIASNGGAYATGDWQMHRAAEVARTKGFSVIEDENGSEFGTSPAPFRCDNALLYFGWYSYNNYNNSFSWTPGAMGFHLDSASAMNPRQNTSWSANALWNGITVTSGALAEPYLGGTLHAHGFFQNVLMEGANVGDAMLRNLIQGKWMNVNFGDPLYRPFPQPQRPGQTTKIFLNGPISASTGLCVPFDVVSMDSKNIPTPASSALSVKLLALNGGGFYQDAACKAAAVQADIAAGQRSTRVYYLNNKSAEQQLWLVSQSSVPADQTPFVFTTHTPTKISSTAATISIGRDCSRIPLIARSSDNFTDNVLTDTAIKLSPLASGQFFSDSNCLSPISQAMIKSNNYQASAYYKNLAASSAQATLADLNNILSPATIQVSILPPSKLELNVNPAYNLPANKCLAVSLKSLTSGNVSSGVMETTIVNLLNNKGTNPSPEISFYNNASCTSTASSVSLAKDSPSATFYIKATKTSSFTLGAAVSSGPSLTEASMYLNFLAQNQAPVVYAGEDKTVHINSPFTLDGSATDDELPSHILTYAWSVVSGPGSVTFSEKNILQPTVMMNALGSYILRLTVSDGALTASDDVAINVINIPGFTLSINADNGHVTKSPDQLYYTSGSKVVLTPFSDQGYRFNGWSGDAVGTSSPLTIIISKNMSINANFIRINAAPLVNAGLDQTIQLPQIAVLKAAAIDNDHAPNQTMKYSWKSVSGPGQVVFFYQENLEAIALFRAPGTYVLSFSAFDGEDTSSDTLAITVEPPPSYPLITHTANGSITRLPNKKTYAQGSRLLLYATPDANYKFLSWSGDVPSTANPLIITMGDKALDITANFVKINQPPVVNAGLPQKTSLNASLLLSGTAKDDGLPNNKLTITWSKHSGNGSVSFSSATKLSTGVKFSAAGTYVLKLTVTDGQLISSSTVTVTVTQ